jgi:hypothetical protein
MSDLFSPKEAVASIVGDALGGAVPLATVNSARS